MELLHEHRCSGCGGTRSCEVMICRDEKYARPCLDCLKAGRAEYPALHATAS